MKLICASDIHGWLFDVPQGDMLILSGDIVPLNVQSNDTSSFFWFKDKFIPWVLSAPVCHVVFIGGNHDFYLQNKGWRFNNEKLHYLCASSTTIDGVKFYGWPYIKHMVRWAFSDLQINYEDMESADVLISHDTPRIINGTFSERDVVRYRTAPGNAELANQMHKYKYCLCGHWHEGNHALTAHDGCGIYNTSLLNDRYEPVNNPLILEI